MCETSSSFEWIWILRTCAKNKDVLKMSPENSAPNQVALHEDIRCSSTDKVDSQFWGVIWDALVYKSLPGRKNLRGPKKANRICLSWEHWEKTLERGHEQTSQVCLENGREESIGRERERESWRRYLRSSRAILCMNAYGRVRIWKKLSESLQNLDSDL